MLAALCGCGSPGVPLPPSLDLPKPVTDLRAVRKGDKVYLMWTVPTETTDRQTVRRLGPMRVCRKLDTAGDGCGELVGEVLPSQLPTPQPPGPANAPPKPRQARYTDTLPRDVQEQHPGTAVGYAISVLNTDGHSAGFSNWVQVPGAPALPPPSDFKALVTAAGVVLSWTEVPEPQTSGMRHAYRIYRREEKGTTDTIVGEVPMGNAASLPDQTFEWQKTYEYRANVVTIVATAGKPDLQVEGDDTPVIKVFASDVFPPAVPSNLEAVASGAGQPVFVDLIWTPGTDADLAGYNIYRHEEGQPPVKINVELVRTPAYRDSSVAGGKKYFYSVSAVDLRGNESARSEEAWEAVP